MKNFVVHTFKLPIDYEQSLIDYTHEQYMTKSDFIRNAVIEKLQSIADSNRVDEIMQQENKKFTHEEVKRNFGL